MGKLSSKAKGGEEVSARIQMVRRVLNFSYRWQPTGTSAGWANRTFNFLGYTFICSKSRKGRFQIIWKTRRDRMMAKLLELKEELRRRMHWPISEQGNG